MTICIRIVVLIAFVVGTPAFALKNDKNEPAVIDADSTEFDFRTGTRTWIGNVKVRQGTMRITADKLVANYKDNVLQHATAYGNPAVFIQRPTDQPDDVIGKGRRLEMDEVNQLVTFFENASLKQGANTVVGKKLIYDMETEKMRVTGQKGIGTKTNVDRAKISIDRSDKKKPDLKKNNRKLTEPVSTAPPETEGSPSNSRENSTNDSTPESSIEDSAEKDAVVEQAPERAMNGSATKDTVVEQAVEKVVDGSASKSAAEERVPENTVEDSAAINPPVNQASENSENLTRTNLEAPPKNQQQPQ